MNSRTVHQLMLRNFPQEQLAPWVYFCECSGRNEQPTVAAFLSEHFGTENLLVEVHRSIGGFLNTAEASALIASHLGKSNIKVSNRAFSVFAVFAQNGVVASWRNAVQLGIQADPRKKRAVGLI